MLSVSLLGEMKMSNVVKLILTMSICIPIGTYLWIKFAIWFVNKFDTKSVAKENEK
jgi:hypothetical protein